MFYNYFKTAFRALHRNFLSSAINIFGLALSMSICLIALTTIRDAFRYDNFHPHPSRTYRIITEVNDEDAGKQRWATAPLPLAEELTQNYPFIEKVTRIYPAISESASYEGKSLAVEGAFTDPNFFEVFGFNLLYGDKRTAFSTPNGLVLTEATSERFFKADNPVGKVLQLKSLGNYTVTGVIKDDGKKTHLEHNLYIPLSGVASLEIQKKLDKTLEDWKNYGAANVFVLLKENVSINSLKVALSKLSGAPIMTSSFRDNKHVTFDFQNIRDITPGEELNNGGNTPSINTLLGIGGVTFLILLLACFNYTNLSLAKALTRAKEVGIRKVVGGSRLQVFNQFIIESILVSLIATGLAAFLLEILKSIPLIGQGMLQGAETDWVLYLIFIVFGIFTGVLAGSVPAWILSSFKPVQVMKSLSSVKIFKGLGIQKTLITIQFAVSLIFVVFLLTIYRQTAYLSSFSYGFNSKNVITVSATGKDHQLFKSAVRSISGIQKVSSSSDLMGFHPGNRSTVKSTQSGDGVGMQSYFIDEDFIDLYGLRLVAGNNFTPAATPGASVIINEMSVAALQLKSPDAAIGQTILMNDSDQVQITGVVKDFNYLNPKLPIGNLILRFDTAHYNFLSIKTVPERREAVASNLEFTFKKIAPNSSFSLTYLEDELKALRTKSEEFSVVGFLALMAITIACIGLLGIVTYASKVRQKEVSIRKVIGADIKSLVFLLSKDFLKLLLIASLIALPIGYLLASTFLKEFAYRITIGWGILAVSTLFILVLGLITICSQTFKVAVSNPAKSLLSE